MDKYTIGDFVRDFNSDSRKLFEFIYKTFYPHIRTFILKNKGNEQDAKDVFQEGVIAVIRNVENKSADPDALVISYLFSICRYIWKRSYNIHDTRVLNENDLSYQYGFEEVEIEGLDESIENGIFQRNFLKLGKKCQDLLSMTLNKIPAREITKKLGFKSENFVFKRKHQCKEQLIKMIKNDAEYINYMKNKKS